MLRFCKKWNVQFWIDVIDIEESMIFPHWHLAKIVKRKDATWIALFWHEPGDKPCKGLKRGVCCSVKVWLKNRGQTGCGLTGAHRGSLRELVELVTRVLVLAFSTL
jgi:hypothetical protein